MKVILNADIKTLGKKGDLVNVSDGYARNFLFPRKLAVEANAANLNTVSQRESAKEYHKSVEIKNAEDLKQQLEKISVTIKVKAGANGKLFGSVTSKEVAEVLASLYGVSVDKKKIVLSEPIKAYGTYILDIKLYANSTAKLNVVVAGEK